MPQYSDAVVMDGLLSAALDDSPGILVKAGQGLLYGWHIKNTTAAALYVQFFDVAALAGVDLGTTTPKLSIGLAANGVAEAQFARPMAFVNGLAIFSTTTVSGSTGAASDVNTFFV